MSANVKQRQFIYPTRVWVNAPSKYEPYHVFHGKCGIAHTDDKGETRLYFTEGSITSIYIGKTSVLETLNSQNNNLRY